MTILNLAIHSGGFKDFFVSLQRIHNHSENFPLFLQALLDLLAESTPLRNLYITVHQIKGGALPLSRRNGTGSQHEWRPSHADIKRLDLADMDDMRVCKEQIVYGHQDLGAIHYVSYEAEPYSMECLSLLKFTAKIAAYFIKRQDLNEWSKEQRGLSFCLAGLSQELLRLEHFIEKASMSCLPVLIQGEFGTEKIHAALAIHAFSERRMSPFIEVDCARSDLAIPFRMQQARRGTLCLNNVHLLSLDHQYALQDLLYPRLGQWTNDSAPSDVRIISITEEDLDVRSANGTFLPSLLSELSFLSFHVPPIRRRKEDIPSLLKALQGHLNIAPSRSIDGNVLQVFCRHDWPGNLFELARVAANLGIMSAGQEVSLNDLLFHAPWLLDASQEPSAEASPVGRLDPSSSRPPDRFSLESWIDHFIQADADGLSSLHDGVSKAIHYLNDHFADPITLDDLARVANLSPSHLSFLFRKEINTSFKELQQCMRIKNAKLHLRGQRRMTITEVAVAVGYTDLSHFERCFRRRVGLSPREYRRLEDSPVLS